MHGRPHGGPRSYGYDESGLAIVEVEAAVVREAARRILSGESTKSVVRDLNARGSRTTTGREWSGPKLTKTLSAPRLAGLRIHRGEIVGDGVWPAVIDRATHDQLVAHFGSRRQVGRPPLSLLAGLIVCGVCGANLQQGAARHDYPRYVCHRAPGRPGCGGVSIRAEQTEEVITDVALERLDTPQLAALTHAPGGMTDDTPELENRMAELAHAYGTGKISMKEWLRAREPLEKDLERSRRKRDEAANSSVLASIRPGVLSESWPTLTLEQRRAVLAAVIERIVIGPAEKRARWDADRISINWRV